MIFFICIFFFNKMDTEYRRNYSIEPPGNSAEKLGYSKCLKAFLCFRAWFPQFRFNVYMHVTFSLLSSVFPPSPPFFFFKFFWSAVFCLFVFFFFSTHHVDVFGFLPPKQCRQRKLK